MTVTVTTRPLFINQSGVYGTWDLRAPFEGAPGGEGVAGYEDYRVRQRAAGAALFVDVGGASSGEMRAWVRGDTREGQGLYYGHLAESFVGDAAARVEALTMEITPDRP